MGIRNSNRAMELSKMAEMMRENLLNGVFRAVVNGYVLDSEASERYSVNYNELIFSVKFENKTTSMRSAKRSRMDSQEEHHVSQGRREMKEEDRRAYDQLKMRADSLSESVLLVRQRWEVTEQERDILETNIWKGKEAERSYIEKLKKGEESVSLYKDQLMKAEEQLKKAEESQKSLGEKLKKVEEEKELLKEKLRKKEEGEILKQKLNKAQEAERSHIDSLRKATEREEVYKKTLKNLEETQKIYIDKLKAAEAFQKTYGMKLKNAEESENLSKQQLYQTNDVLKELFNKGSAVVEQIKVSSSPIAELFNEASKKKMRILQTCPACSQPFTESEEHNVCSLKCGHSIGRSCITNWKEKDKNSKHFKCPQCSRRTKFIKS